MSRPKNWPKEPNKTLKRQDTALAKVNVNPQEFEDLIKVQGMRVKVYRSTYCPRVKSIDGAEHEIDCPLCHGAQFIDRDPITTYALLQQNSLEKKHLEAGLLDNNQLAATFQLGIELQYFTRVELLDFTELYIERKRKQAGDLDILRYPGKTVNILVDYNGKEYFQGTDFKLDANGSIKWYKNKGPAPGTIYSISYKTAVRYRAIRAMHSNRYSQVDVADKVEMLKMPEQWQLVKDYLVESKDLDGNLLKTNKIEDDSDYL